MSFILFFMIFHLVAIFGLCRCLVMTFFFLSFYDSVLFVCVSRPETHSKGMTVNLHPQAFSPKV